MHWLLTAHGLFTQNMTIVTAYDTLGEEGLLHSMNETEVEAIFSSAELLPTVKRVAKSCPSLKLIVYQGIANHEDLDSSELGSVKIRSLDEVIKLGKEHPIDPRLPEPEDLCCIMYTSGSTGNPKGVMLSHKNVVAAGKPLSFYVGSFLFSNTLPHSCVIRCYTWPPYLIDRFYNGIFTSCPHL